MQIRYYLGLASLGLGLAGFALGSQVYGESWPYISACLCALGMLLIMTSTRRNRTGTRRIKNRSSPNRIHHGRRRARHENRKNGGDGHTDHADGDGGDGGDGD